MNQRRKLTVAAALAGALAWPGAAHATTPGQPGGEPSHFPGSGVR